eukprot:TRINITY_DN11901_c0_g1_i1.p1 TRINITY_DN11901_c0_g1~~TRINITY_DN11901_c0_g1_i1.p1  ORF type:complete len:255 (-),score=35.80 TRINITY_DN11901_c0_g1_i1:90-797(-)
MCIRDRQSTWGKQISDFIMKALLFVIVISAVSAESFPNTFDNEGTRNPSSVPFKASKRQELDAAGICISLQKQCEISLKDSDEIPSENLKNSCSQMKTNIQNCTIEVNKDLPCYRRCENTCRCRTKKFKLWFACFLKCGECLPEWKKTPIQPEQVCSRIEGDCFRIANSIENSNLQNFCLILRSTYDECVTNIERNIICYSYWVKKCEAEAQGTEFTRCLSSSDVCSDAVSKKDQ